jgi:hypothetical protein
VFEDPEEKGSQIPYKSMGFDRGGPKLPLESPAAAHTRDGMEK